LASSLDSLLAATSDLIVQDVYRGHIHQEANEEQLRAAAKWVTLGLGVIAWLLCLPRLTTLASLLYFMGAFVASTIWPIAAGLYWRRTNPLGAALAMVAGTTIGLTAYFVIGFYVAALVSAVVSMSTVVLTTWLWPVEFDWERLNEGAQEEVADDGNRRLSQQHGWRGAGADSRGTPGVADPVD
jgi:Na+/proline symporter